VTQGVGAHDIKRRPSAVAGRQTRPNAERLTYELPKFDEVKARHHALMVDYLQALDATAALSDETERFWATWRKATRLWVGSHIRARVLVLANRYTALRQVCNTEHQDMSQWLKDSREECTAFADSLDSLRIPSLLALLPLALSVATAVAKVQLFVVLLVLSPSAGFFIFLPFIVISSFRQKRELLLPGARTLDKGGASTGDHLPERNAYKAEEALFGLFKQRKPREFQVDEAIQSLFLGTLLLAALLLPTFLLNDITKELFYLGCGVAGLVLGGGLRLMARHYRHRHWR